MTNPLKRTATALLVATALGAPCTALADTVFGVVGDVPYGDKALAKFPELVASMENASPEFVIHVGDIKGGSAPCTDQMLTSRVKAIDDIRLPVVFVPGDNDWTDCHRRRAGRYKPLERLQFLRRIAYPEIGASLGSPTLTVQSQAMQTSTEEFLEHQFWTSGNTSFLTLHVLGSDNGFSDFKDRSAADDNEAISRIAATIDWLKQGFEQAQSSDAIVVAIHGNPFGMSKKRARKYPVRPYAEFLSTLTKAARDFDKPVLLIHGDTHDYKFDQPLEDATGETLTNIYRLEGIGSPDIGWVEVTIKADMASPFTVKPVFVDQ